MSKVTIAERIFNVVRDTPGLSEENIHEILSVDVKYKTTSGKALIYRMIRVKFLRKDRNGRFFTHIDAYKPLPAYKPKKKKPPVDSVAEAAKLHQIAQYQAASDQLGKTINAVVTALAHVQPEPKPVTGGFLGGLGRRISAYFR
jgi:hypothetical protein